MNKTPRLSKSGIEYLDYVWNFYSGCHNKKLGICQVQNCWAEAITKRMKHNYPNGFEPTFYPEAFTSPLHLKKPSTIGCAFMGDLFGDWVKPDMKIESMLPSGFASLAMSLKGWIFTTLEQCPQHTFLFLTKCPWNLPKWGRFPDNCWVGVTATDEDMLRVAITHLAKIEAKIKYLSFEPLLGWGDFYKTALSGWLTLVDWVIIGAQTKPTVYPKIEWVREIVQAADKAGIPVFLKNNLIPMFITTQRAKRDEPFIGKDGWSRQEMP